MKMVKKLSLLLAVVMLISSMGLTALAGSYLGTLRVVNCQNWVTLRSGPSTSSSSLCKVPLGASVTAYYYNSEFTECYYNGYWGYILSTYLSGNNSSNTTAGYSDYLGKKTIVNCKEFVTLRSYASTSASAVTRVAKGQVVDAYYYNGTFSYCVYNGMSGYILNDYLSSSSSSSAKNYSTTYYNTLEYAYIVNCQEWVSLRANPSTSATRLDTIPLGGYIEIHGYSGNFVYCYYDGQWGYVHRDYISIDYDVKTSPSYIINCNEWVSLRADTSTSSARLAMVPLGAVVVRRYDDGQWVTCYYDGMWGYIRSEYVS